MISFLPGTVAVNVKDNCVTSVACVRDVLPF